MMRKFSVLFVLVMSSVVFAQAQQSTTPSESTSNPGGFIIKGGVNLSNISTQNDGGYSDANTLTTFNVGVLADVPLADILSLQPGVVFTGKGFKADASLAGITSTYKFNPFYIEVPVNVVVKLPLGGESQFSLEQALTVQLVLPAKRKVKQQAAVWNRAVMITSSSATAIPTI